MLEIISRLEDVLSIKDIELYEKLLDDTPFVLDDFNITNNNVFKCKLDKDVFFSELLLGYDLASLTFMIGNYSKRYEMIEELIEEEEWIDLFTYAIEKRDLINSFIYFYEDIEEELIKECFLIVYKRSEYGFSDLEFMLEDMLEYVEEDYSELKGKTIYRGLSTQSNEEGYSWTTDYKTALFFAERFNKGVGGVVLKANIDTEGIIDYDKEGREQEVILIPSYLYNIESIEL